MHAIVVAVAVAVAWLPTAFALSTTASRNVLIEDVQRAIIDIHASEVTSGRDAFFEKPFAAESSCWGDEAFLGRNLGANNAGTDAKCLPKNGNMIFESASPVLSESECSFIVEEARETILRGLRSENETNDGYSMSNSQLGEARLSNMPKTRDWLKETLPARFYPLLKDRFGVDDLVLYDGLVLGNHAPTRSQPIHRDASLLTLNVALSAPSEYEGGGTYVEALDETLVIDKGHLLCHAGSAMHAGNAISQGERWVFVLFLLGENQPQLARRCHAKAIEHMRREELEEAETCLQAGLKSIAPHHDHLLLGTLGRLQVQKGEYKRAFESFSVAQKAYPICQNAIVSLAQLLIDRKRPRAALRRLDQALEQINDRDLSEESQMSLKALAYGCRRDAARCALLCADYLYQQNGNTSWSKGHLPAAISRIETCLVAAPNEPTLLAMLDRAEFLVVEANQS